MNTPAVAALVRDGKSEQLYGTMEMSRGVGMRTMNQALAQAYKAGKINYDDMIEVTTNLEDLKRILDGS